MSKPLFKPGDRVIRTRESISHVVKGEVYTVKTCSFANITFNEIAGMYGPPYFTLVNESEDTLTEFLN